MPSADDRDGRFELIKDRVELASRFFTALTSLHNSSIESESDDEHGVDSILPSPETLWRQFGDSVDTIEVHLLSSIASTLLHDITPPLYDYYDRFSYSDPKYEIYC